MTRSLLFCTLLAMLSVLSNNGAAAEAGPPLPSNGGAAANESDFDAAAFDSEMGELHLLVFSAANQTPIQGAQVFVGKVKLGETNADGALTIFLFGGLYHLTIDVGDGVMRTAAVRVIPEQISEVLAEAVPASDEMILLVEQSDIHRVKADAALENAPIAILTGEVVHEETRAPIGDARVFVRGAPVEATTDTAGRFRLEVPSGVLDVVVVHPDFGTVTKSGVEVKPHVETHLIIEASPGGVELEELTVTAPKIEGSAVEILSERRETAKVTDIIGAEQMSKSGDSDAAAALKRVTGITIVDGKYVYVRGLGERYTSTLLNELRLPSPDPERRVVPLDMFPASILESMIIQKTFSPEMPGDFGGGTVNLRTKGYPEEPMFKIELSGGIKPGTTFSQHEFATDKGPLNILGIDAGHRAIPQALADATRDQKLKTGDRFTPGYTDEEIAEITRAMPNNWKTADKRLPPDFGLSLTGGNGFTIKKTKFGFFTSLLYKNEWDTTDKTIRDYVLSNAETGDLALSNDYKFYETKNEITLGGILSLGLDFGQGQSITANTLVDRITDNEFTRQNGYSQDTDGYLDVYNYAWTERMLVVQQLKGSHLLHQKSGFYLDWRYAFASANQDQPDKRHTRYDYLEGRDLWVLSSGSDGNRREYITVDERSHDMGIDFALPFHQWTAEEAKISAGAAILLKDRIVDLRSFGYETVDALELETRALPPWEVFVDENIVPGGMNLQEWTQPADNYEGSQEVFAGYASADLPLGAGFSASGGVRFENSVQEVLTYDVFGTKEEVIKSNIDTFDVLPALVLTYRFREDMLVRIGYGKTLNRPDFREMSPGCVRSYAGKGKVCGASEEFPLNRTVIHNVDARWEWYFGMEENISLGAFYKEFIDPIESVLIPSSQKTSQLMNAEGARDLGLELELRKNFGFANKFLEDLYVGGNAAWIYSQIEIPENTNIIQTSKNRPLQGQSPYVVNAQLGYDNVDIGLNATLLYNVSGPRISDVGLSGQPDIYEQQFHQLDLVIKQKLKKDFQIGFKAKNLIDLPVEFSQGDHVTETYKKGREFSLSLAWSY